MKRTIKSIDHMSIYHPYACLDEERFITVRHVENQKEIRLSRSEGNVNLTDYWFSILDNLAFNNKSCSCQNIGLLADVGIDEDINWWSMQNGKYIGIGFLKIDSSIGLSIQEAMIMLEAVIGESGRLFRTLDNADIIVALSVMPEKKENLWELVNKICECNKSGQSVYFSKYFVYGVGETEVGFLKIKELIIGTGREASCKKHLRYDGGWCDRLITDMVNRINGYKEQQNKKMMSYYQALLQILNVLGQYEQETIRKDLFYIFYPSISAFISRLEESQEEVNIITEKISTEIPYDDKRELVKTRQIMNVKIEKSIGEFLDTMELLMHHIGQSCEEIIGESGHGGMPYDIPLRICLMYISFLNVLSDVLVEEESVGFKRKEFEYCLTPLAYTQPATIGFHIGNTEKGRLIRVNVPRHMLFMPRSFLVILAHEASHYAHERSRRRIERAKCMRKIVEYVMCETLISNDVGDILDTDNESERAILHNYFTILSENLQNYLEKSIYETVEQEGGEEAQRYHLDYYTKKLLEVCRTIFYDENHMLLQQVSRIDNTTVNAMRNIDSHPKLYQKIACIQKSILNNAERAAFDEMLHRFLENLKIAFREIYADISAVRMLQLSWDDYLEAYIISESHLPNWEDLPPETLNRLAMVKYVLEKKEVDGWGREKGENIYKNEYSWRNIQAMKNPIKEYAEKIAEAVQKYSEEDKDIKEKEVREGNENGRDPKSENDWFYCEPILAWEAEFFEACDDSFTSYVKEKEKGSELKLLRNLHKSFMVKPQNKDGKFEDFFEAFDELTVAYKHRVDQKYQYDLKTMV